jgi:hypothetical protein
MSDFDKTAEKMKKKWNFVPFSYSPPHGLIDLVQVFGTPYLTLQIHRINFPDPAGYYHDHPWSFVSLIIKGGYHEYIWDDPYNVDDFKTKKRPLLSVHAVGSSKAHRIFKAKPGTLTVFLCGKWIRNGFRFYRNGKDFDVTSMIESSSGGNNMINMR